MSNKTESVVAPIKITVHEKSGSLKLLYPGNEVHEFSSELLRVFSPSAEVVGHGPGQRVNPVGKQNVKIKKIEPVGNYAVKLTFSDGHDTGIYSWKYFRWLGANKERIWAQYIEEVKDKSGPAAGVRQSGIDSVSVKKENL